MGEGGRRDNDNMCPKTLLARTNASALLASKQEQSINHDFSTALCDNITPLDI